MVLTLTTRSAAASRLVLPSAMRRATTSSRYAATGVDEEFHKGENAFGRQYGDPAHQPNVNLGPIDQAPFYAIAVVPTPLGTALGLRTNTEAQVLTDTDQAINGLYAVGNDANSVMGSHYPGAGCQVGAGMTFGYVAARHAAKRDIATVAE